MNEGPEIVSGPSCSATSLYRGLNFSDPFGLCPIEEDGIPCTVTMGVSGAVAGAAAGAIVGGTGGTFVVPGMGTIVGAGGGALAGGTAGLQAGTLAGAARDLVSIAEMSGVGDKLKEGVRKGLIILGGIIGIAHQEIPPGPPPEERKKKAKEEQVEDKKGGGPE